MKKMAVLFVMLVVASTVAFAESNELQGKIQFKVQKAIKQHIEKVKLQQPEDLKSEHDALLEALNATFEGFDAEQRNYFYHQNLIGPAEALEEAYVQLKNTDPKRAEKSLKYLKKQSYSFGPEEANKEKVTLETILSRLQTFRWNDHVMVEIHVNVLRHDLNNL